MIRWLVNASQFIALAFLLAAVSGVARRDAAEGSTNCWEMHWKPSSVSGETCGYPREVGKTHVIRRFILGQQWSWWSYDRNKGFAVMRDHFENILPGTQWTESPTEAGGDLRIRHGNICEPGNPGCESHVWYYDAARGGYYFAQYTSKLNTANYDFATYDPFPWYSVSTHETAHLHGLDDVTYASNQYPISIMDRICVDQGTNTINRGCDSVWYTTPDWDIPRTAAFYGVYQPTEVYSSRRIGQSNVLDIQWRDNSWAEKRYRREFWYCPGGAACTELKAVDWEFYVANKDVIIVDSWTKPAALPDGYYLVGLFAENDIYGLSPVAWAPYKINLLD